jgi:hypothetical protein
VDGAAPHDSWARSGQEDQDGDAGSGRLGETSRTSGKESPEGSPGPTGARPGRRGEGAAGRPGREGPSVPEGGSSVTDGDGGPHPYVTPRHGAAEGRRGPRDAVFRHLLCQEKKTE